MTLSKPKAISLADIPANYNPKEGDIRWNGGEVEKYTGSAWVVVGGGGGGSKFLALNIAGMDLGYSNPATPATLAPSGTPPTGLPGVRVDALQFSDDARYQGGWVIGRFPDSYAGTNLSLKLKWYATPTIGDVVWNAAFCALSNLDGVTNKVFNDPQSVTSTVSASTKTLTEAVITFTQAQADGIAAGDIVTILLQRNTDDAADTMVGIANLVSAELSWE